MKKKTKQEIKQEIDVLCIKINKMLKKKFNISVTIQEYDSFNIDTISEEHLTKIKKCLINFLIDPRSPEMKKEFKKKKYCVCGQEVPVILWKFGKVSYIMHGE